MMGGLLMKFFRQQMLQKEHKGHIKKNHDEIKLIDKK
jgi:hypothetical protein